MALRNRVTPEGEIIAHPSKAGVFMGNRGILHDDAGDIVRTHALPAWITCLLDFRDRKPPVPLVSPGRYTRLFFLDEAVALAAGHRPCGECRRRDYKAFRAAWAAATGADLPGPREMDRALHAARIVPRRRIQRTFEADLADLPDGTFIRATTGPALILGDRLLPWTPDGYGPPLRRPGTGRVTVLTPAPTVAVLRAGYRPVLHPSATAGAEVVADGPAKGAT